MEGERAFVQDINPESESAKLLIDNPKIAFKYSIGGGFKKSDGWEPLGPAGYYDTFGPELSFGRSISTAFSQKKQSCSANRDRKVHSQRNPSHRLVA